jgi:dienelactone hydrolase
VKEHHIQVSRTARYYTLGPAANVPGDGGRDPRAGAVGDLWFVLHGYRQLAGRFLNRFREVEASRRVVVAPEALSRFYVEDGPGRHGPESRVGATWMTREHRDAEIGDYVGYLDRVRGRVLADVPWESARVTVLGFSQGAHTAARWAVHGDSPPGRLVLWGEYLPPDLDMELAAQRLRGVDLVLVMGERDMAHREELARDQARRLDEAGLAHRVLTHPGGHEIDPGLLRELASSQDRT